ncbi:MAG TPA: ABC transporter permease subunit [Gemmatales bacterium]|nr:ABC transporter permease subunit [Gemmatales bacterium]
MSRLLITLGGIGTIIAVALVCIFLVWVTIPLFSGAKTESREQQRLTWPGKPLLMGVDSDQILGWAVLADGSFSTFRLDTGEIILTQPLFVGAALTAVSHPSRHDQFLVGFADGTIRLGKISTTAELLDESKAATELKALVKNSSIKHNGGVAHRHENGSISFHQAKAVFDAPVALAAGQAVRAVDLSTRSTGPILASLTADGKLRISEVTETKNLITGKVKRELSGGEMMVTPREGNRLPEHVLINGVGDNVYLIWNDGTLQRVDARSIKSPRIVEEVKLTEGGAELTALQFMIGKTTLITGDSSGRVRAWFRVQKELPPLKPGETRKIVSHTGPDTAAGSDENRLVAAHELPQVNSKVTSIATSSRSRILAVSYADGSSHLFNLTNERPMATVQLPDKGVTEQLILAPKEDGLYAWSKEGIASWSLQTGHPEVSLGSLIRPIWYEGYPGPAHVWQSSSGDDAFESKFGLWPLVFGTLKATFYSLLLGVPLALCAAVYTREFLHPRVRSVIKPTIEVMASLPSVVLGFLAALVIAPFVSNSLMTIVLGFAFVPLGFVLAGFLWHMLPSKWIRALQGFRFLFIITVLPCMILLAVWLAGPIEQFLFDGDFKQWLGRPPGKNSASGWLILLLPVGGLATLFLISNVVNPWIRTMSRKVSVSREAILNLLKCVLGICFNLAVAWLGAHLLAWLGFDPRTSFFGVYDQRNALVVGMMMGFAIIPIIYTLAEDALSSVPDHLRSASLGCGATNWQTASRIVLPTAMSGIFSAVMVGLGRAVGETMIVLMAAGNVPVLDMNIFNGFRTLSANIAVELPEAVQGSTHYRTLFLAALTLFIFTFALNTFAESMRQRFRKRAFEL